MIDKPVSVSLPKDIPSDSFGHLVKKDDLTWMSDPARRRRELNRKLFMWHDGAETTQLMRNTLDAGFAYDHQPVCHVYLPQNPIHFLMGAAQSCPDLHYKYWGLIDLGLGQVDVGEFRLIDYLTPLFNLTGYVLTRDLNFENRGKRLSDFLRKAHETRRIVV